MSQPHHALQELDLDEQDERALALFMGGQVPLSPRAQALAAACKVGCLLPSGFVC